MTSGFYFFFAGFIKNALNRFALRLTMASSLHLPRCKITNNLCSRSTIAHSFTQIPCQSRPFSQTSQRWAYKNMNFSPKNLTGPSMKARSREALNGQLPNDIGLLPGTFVRPLWRDLPSVFQNPRERWQVEWAWIRSSFQNLMGLVVSVHITVANFEPLDRWNIRVVDESEI